MSLDLIDALKQIEREKDIPLKTLVETMEAALVSAYKKNFGAAGSIRVALDIEHSGFRVFAQKSVTELPVNTHTEISLAEAQLVKPAVTLGEAVEVEVTPTNFGRIAAQTAKQVLMQRIREAERESIYDEYCGREGEMVSGEAQRAERRNVFVNLGRVEALLPQGEQVPGEAYRFGTRLKVYILEVRKTTKSPQVVVSRSHPGLVRRLFELEVPEIQEGVVELKGVAREAGARTKIAVKTNDENVDPVGACVGHRGSRVQGVVNELNEEKIDIVRWEEDPSKFISNSLSPAKVSSVLRNEEDRSATVIVPDDQQSLAIGRSGQNVRLAARLTGWRIDIRTQDQYDLSQRSPEEVLADEAKALAESIPVGDSEASESEGIQCSEVEPSVVSDESHEGEPEQVTSSEERAEEDSAPETLPAPEETEGVKSETFAEVAAD
ncbi:MAG: transcription termination/antitermination protein NusA [Armatimonadetes bacterium]|nr:transcription termination/antitermination protein NusA [Armatimonadota bacterium]